MALLKLCEVKSRHQMMPTVNAGVTGTFRKATSTMGISGVIIARPPRTPVSCFVGFVLSTGAENANLMPLRLNSTMTMMRVAMAVAAIR